VKAVLVAPAVQLREGILPRIGAGLVYLPGVPPARLAFFLFCERVPRKTGLGVSPPHTFSLYQEHSVGLLSFLLPSPPRFMTPLEEKGPSQITFSRGLVPDKNAVKLPNIEVWCFSLHTTTWIPSSRFTSPVFNQRIFQSWPVHVCEISFSHFFICQQHLFSFAVSGWGFLSIFLPEVMPTKTHLHCWVELGEVPNVSQRVEQPS